MKKLSVLLAASALTTTAMVVATPAAAQQTTSGIEGTVRADTGAAIENATVVITDTRTGATSTQMTGADGRFNTTGLPTGGPYMVAVNAPGYQGQVVENVFINLTGSTSFSFDLASASDTVTEEAIVITGSRAGETQRALGPGQSISQEVLETLPTISRDVRDFIRIDPRVAIETSGDDVDRISCLGGNDRTNVFTVDGIAQADLFGLNNTPFAGRNSGPIPFDAIKETAVEFAPFDVEYGAFTGCAINAVTKSGTNEFHGSAFFEYRDQDMRGDTAGGETFEKGVFDEKRFGATLGGPILKDRLFFFAGYEELDAASAIDRGPKGMGFANEVDFVTEDQFNTYSDILSRVYGYDIGPIVRSAPNTNQKYFGRIDAYITDDHRLEATYQHFNEDRVESDFGGGSYGGLNSYENEGTNSDYYSARLFSQWTDRLSTEVRYSRSEISDKQGPVGGGEAQEDNPIVRLVVGVLEEGCTVPAGQTLEDVIGTSGCEAGTLNSGPGIFRSANQLDYTVDQAKALANYEAGDHFITVGGEMNHLDIYNLFIINATGTLYFENFADLEEGLLAGGRGFFPDGEDLVLGDGWGADINATPTGDPNEAAAEWNRTIWSAYVQDDWTVTDQLNVLFGLRAEFYSGSTPRENPNFLERYGFANNPSFDNLDPLVMPRVAFAYELDNNGFFYNSKVTGGIGLFSGGDPAVWLSNAFSNNGFIGNSSTRFANCSGENMTNGQIDVVVNGQFTGFIDCVFDAARDQAARGLGDTQSTDQDLKLATVTRANLGFGTRFGDGSGGLLDDWNLNVDYIYSRYNNPYNFVDLIMAPDLDRLAATRGFAVDGRPIYSPIDPTRSSCNAELVKVDGQYQWTNLSPSCFGTGRDDEIQLTNAEGYASHTVSAVLRKNWRGGLVTSGGGGYFNFGYAFTDAYERRTNDNSTATSGYDRTAAFDRWYPEVRQSSYVSEHNFSVSVGLREEFVEDYQTSLGVFFRATSGRPYSLVYGEGADRDFGFQDSSSGDFNALAYIPTGVNDPNLSPFSDPAAVTDFLAFVEESNCEYIAGLSILANTCRNPWYFDMDLRIAQELPGPGNLFGVDDRIELFATMDNFLNFIDGDWNALRTYGTTRGMIEGGVDDDGLYVIERFNSFRDEPADVRTNASTWRLKIGARYEF
ncbi:TonB-dependent receptor [Sphingomicrobium astaxanthinifaciens]|uniref:TonB-dependent receptor n=1 Tax=Sphingomicrobium astaxanthinifaciens TaxID=1227949 RepID=UPI001FCC9B6F|nr:TonB-dependent receptor [Sphingomicrobium astaxanthinifaciens]MCJ7421958.1 carboxypeptidase regulatory-like domain-containing protein [Sphingomicrobium astaxanthinifaciens]